MNKYQKALDILDMSFDYKEVKEARILLKKLIDKKTPKKPIFDGERLERVVIKR